MANLYWVGGSGNWTDNLNHWSFSSGGAPGARQPNGGGNFDTAVFDANSFSADGQTLSFALASGTCMTFDMTAITHNVTINFAGGGLSCQTFLLSSLNTVINTGINGGIIVGYGGDGTGTSTIDTSGVSLSMGSTGSLRLDASAALLDLTVLSDLNLTTGTLAFAGDYGNPGTTINVGSYNMSAKTFRFSSGGGFMSVNMGSGTWTITQTSGPNTMGVLVVNNPTIDGGTATLNVQGSFNTNTHNYTFGDLHIVGTTTFSGSGDLVFNDVTVPTTDITVTFAASKSLTTNSFTANGSSGHFIFLRSSSGGTPAILSAMIATVSYLDVEDNTAAGIGIPFIDYLGFDSGGNTNWIFPAFPSGDFYLQNVYMAGADTNGTVQMLNAGKSDDGTPIYYELETQELEFGNRNHLKKIADKIVVFTHLGGSSQLQARTNVQEYSPVSMDLNERVNIGKKINLEGNYVTFKWFGQSSTESPVFEGLYLEDITELGLTYG